MPEVLSEADRLRILPRKGRCRLPEIPGTTGLELLRSHHVISIRSENQPLDDWMGAVGS